MTPANRVIVNTGAQYLRSIINACLSLYSTRLILSALGTDDYAIYTLVAGVVLMLSFVVNAMVVTTQRYMSFYTGREDLIKLKEIFNTSLFLHFILGVGVVFIIEFAGVFLFNGFLKIIPDRIETAKMVYHLTAAILFISFITAPFKSLLISHENVVYSSIIDVVDGVLKLLIAIIILSANSDRLILYVVLLVGIAVFDLFAFSLYDFYRYDECGSLSIKKINRHYINELTSFAGWTIYSTGCIIGRTQGVAIILNHYFVLVVNASYGIALQVSAAMSFLSSSLLNALNPQIMKAEAKGDRIRMLRLSEIESKFAFFLMSMLMIPCIFEMPAILSIWLKNVPEYSAFFCRLILIASLVDQLTMGLTSANQAIGNIKYYSLVVNTIKLLTIVVVLIGLWIITEVYIVMVLFVSVEFICAMARLLFLKRTGGLSILGFAKRVFARELLPSITLILSCWIIVSVINIPYRFFVTISVSALIYIISIYMFGLCPDEKDIVQRLIRKISKRDNKKISIIF